jgi:hypothetical protein
MTVRWPKRWLMGSGVLFGIAALWLLAAMTSTPSGNGTARGLHRGRIPSYRPRSRTAAPTAVTAQGLGGRTTTQANER